MKVEVADACQKGLEMFNHLATKHNVNIVGTVAISDKDLSKRCPAGEIPMQVTNFSYPKNP